ncbi:uncharacterized protein BKA78DRAFT_31784 [Phyllosticta capitalensis]|uniref:uncharacterized protein n=1 Tax=Phyllosticta capitalensis TaxID=121624 RepID=UPI00312FA549
MLQAAAESTPTKRKHRLLFSTQARSSALLVKNGCQFAQGICVTSLCTPISYRLLRGAVRPSRKTTRPNSSRRSVSVPVAGATCLPSVVSMASVSRCDKNSVCSFYSNNHLGIDRNIARLVDAVAPGRKEGAEEFQKETSRPRASAQEAQARPLTSPPRMAPPVAIGPSRALRLFRLRRRSCLFLFVLPTTP